MNLAANLTETARRHGGRTALSFGDSDTSYRELDAGSARVAGMLLARGVRPGDRVGVMLPNVPEFAIAYYGALRAGGGRGADEPAVQGARGRPLCRRTRARRSCSTPTPAARRHGPDHGVADRARATPP